MDFVDLLLQYRLFWNKSWPLFSRLSSKEVKPERLTQDTDIHERAHALRVKLCDNIDKLNNALDLKSAVPELGSRETDLSSTWFLGLQWQSLALEEEN